MIDGSWLVMSQGPQPGQTFMLDRDWLTVGRDPSNDIVINDPQVSRQHARITRQGQMVVIEDLGSTNGTFANGMRLTGSHVLSNGDVIGLGNGVTLTYYEVGIAADVAETIVGQPGSAVSPDQVPDALRQAMEATPPPPSASSTDAMAAPQAASPMPPPPPAAAQQPMPAAYTVPPQPDALEAQADGRSKATWFLIGCGVIVLLVILACAIVIVLDAFAMLPDIFYAPILWFNLEQYFVR